MSRVAIAIEYDGSRYHGWQTQQEGVLTIQPQVEKALSYVANEPIQLVAAGRTDKGVHALAQIAHFDSQAERTMKAWVMGANSNLPHDITVRWAVPVTPEFHARFKAVSREYRYVILNRPMRPALLRQHVCWTWQPLHIERMQQAAKYLLGQHDFSAFRAADCQAKSPVKTIHAIEWQRHGDWLAMHIKADGFLQHMVRNIAGVMLAIGSGKQRPEWANDVLLSCDRRCGGVTASPSGLSMVKVNYPPEFVLPELPYFPDWLPEALVQGWKQVHH